MKKFYLRAFLSLLFLLPALTASAEETFTINDLKFYRIDDTYTVGVLAANSDIQGEIVIPDNVTYNGINYTVVELGREAFSGCTKLTSISIPNSTTWINRDAFWECINLTSVLIPNSVTYIGTYAFGGCFNLSSITIPTSVTYIGKGAFYACSSLTSITIPESVENIAEEAFQSCTNLSLVNFNAIRCDIKDSSHGIFYNCKSLTTLVIGEKVTQIPSNILNDCSTLKNIYYNAVSCTHTNAFANIKTIENVVIGERVKSIPDYQFFGCTGINKLVIPNAITNGHGDYVTDNDFLIFNGCEKLITATTSPTTQTKAHVSLTKGGDIKSSTSDTDSKNYAVFIRDSKYEIQESSKDNQLNKSFDVSGLRPGGTNVAYGFVVNGQRFITGHTTVNTLPISIGKPTSLTKTASSLKVKEPTANIGDATLEQKSWAEYPEVQGNLHLTGLTPNTTYSFNYQLTASGSTVKSEQSFTTDKLTFATLPGQALNLTMALLCAEANVDEEEVNVGFEWRRYDAPSTLPSSKVRSAVVDGTIQGALAGLNPEVYYNYRPFYTDDAGTTYYGDWMTFFTGDAGVWFDPTVRTYSAEVLDSYSAVLKGYALRGSADIARQGFQFWPNWGNPKKAPAYANDGDIKEIEVSGQRFSTTLKDLVPNTSYTYRTFVLDEKGNYTYGDEVTFETPEVNGVAEVIADDNEGEIYFRGSLSQGNVEALVANHGRDEAMWQVLNMGGLTMDGGSIPADGTWQPLGCRQLNPGMYILLVRCDNLAKSFKIVVR